MLAHLAVPGDATAAELFFEAEARDVAAPMQPIEQAIIAFQGAVNFGMFGERGRMEVTARGTRIDGFVRQQWWTEGLQPSAYRVLIDMLEAIDLYELPLIALRLQSASEGHSTLDVRTIMASAYPSRPQQIHFALRLRRDIAEAKEPVVRISFASEIPDEVFETLSSVFQVWDAVVLRGGYGGDFGALTVNGGTVDSQTYMTSRDTVEHLLYWTIGAEEAFDALINAATRIHNSVCHLLAFEVE